MTVIEIYEYIISITQHHLHKPQQDSANEFQVINCFLETTNTKTNIETN